VRRPRLAEAARLLRESALELIRAQDQLRTLHRAEALTGRPWATGRDRDHVRAATDEYTVSRIICGVQKEFPWMS
jgi:hypothetical protein